MHSQTVLAGHGTGRCTVDTILSSNIPHYRYLARALYDADLLRRYITTLSVGSEGRVPAVVPIHWKRKLEGRRLTGLPNDKVRQLYIPELLQRGLPATGLVSDSRGNWINNHLFDWLAQRWIEPCSIFTFVNTLGLYCAKKAKRLGARVVCDIRQNHPAVEGSLLMEEGHRFGVEMSNPDQLTDAKQLAEYELADYLVVPSEFARRTFVDQGFCSDKIKVVPYGVDHVQFSPVPRSPRFTILFVGRLNLRKGVLYLLEAVKQLRLPDIEVLLIGGLDMAISPLLHRFEGLFRYIPSVPKLELFRYYGRSSVLVLPSIADAYPLVTLEAMACGTPVIVTPNTGTSSLIDEGVQGFVVPIRNVDAIRERLHWLYLNREAAVEMGRSALALSAGQTWEEYGRKSVELYTAICDGRSPLTAAARPA